MRGILNALGKGACRCLILMVRAYQIVISPHLGNCCRFTPSCSAYCIEALQTHGFWKGCALTVRRLLRCRPFGPYGYDPVPPKREPHHAERKT
ncbi:MAG: membrane protein insertion efficiency factor YidD [Kiritimatiellae bacterium]|nr:membrane protein insertion efficiency factor YidD [Kiritimatiellia bacterium]